MRLSEQNQRLLSFLGYGTKHPRIVFLGAEESDGGGSGAALHVRRTKFAKIEDMRSATEKLSAADAQFNNAYADETCSPVVQWNTAARIRLALAGVESWDAYNMWSWYWRTYLGRRTGDTFVMECFPLPRKGLGTKIEGYSARRAWSERVSHLRAFTLGINPRYVVAYGKDANEHVEELFPATSKWRVVAGVKNVWLARLAHGGVVARVRFFGNGGFRNREIGPIRDAMWKLGSGPCRLHRAALNSLSSMRGTGSSRLRAPGE